MTNKLHILFGSTEGSSYAFILITNPKEKAKIVSIVKQNHLRFSHPVEKPEEVWQISFFISSLDVQERLRSCEGKLLQSKRICTHMQIYLPNENAPVVRRHNQVIEPPGGTTERVNFCTSHQGMGRFVLCLSLCYFQHQNLVIQLCKVYWRMNHVPLLVYFLKLCMNVSY